MAALIFDNNTVSGGPFVYAYYTQAFRASDGTLYVPFAKAAGGTNQSPRLFESTDDGATWAESDNTGAPTGKYLVQSAGKRPDEDLIVFSYFDATTGKLCLWRFDMAAGAWEASAYATGGPDYVGTDVWGEPRLVIRCDGSVLVQIKTADSGGYRQTGYAIWDGASWTTGSLGDATTHWRPEALYITPDQTAHFITSKGPVLGKYWFVHQVVDVNDSVGSAENIDQFPSQTPFNKTFAQVTASEVYLTLYAETVAFTDNGNPDHMPAMIFGADHSLSPTWTAVCPWLYTDAINAPWLDYLPVAYGETGYVWSERQGDYTYKFYFHGETVTGQEISWALPALLWAGTGEDNLISGRGIDAAGFTGAARTAYNGTGAYHINDLRTNTLNPASYCGGLSACRYYANQ